MADSPNTPFETDTRTVLKWSKFRTDSLTPGLALPIYHQPGGVTRLPDWTPTYLANVSLSVRVAHQFGGAEAARALAAGTQQMIAMAPESERPKFLAVPENDLHVKVSFLGLTDLRRYLQLYPNVSKAQMGSLARAIARDYAPQISALRAATKTIDPFMLNFRGMQAVNNSVVARALGGGDKLNILAAAAIDAVPELQGDDPFTDPCDKNPETKAWGLASHATTAIYGDVIDAEVLNDLMHAPGHGVWGRSDIGITNIGLELHTWEVVENDRGELVGAPFRHPATITTFNLAGIENTLV